MEWPDGKKYEGQFLKDKKSGKGTFTWVFYSYKTDGS
jgi:hypothetical protein